LDSLSSDLKAADTAQSAWDESKGSGLNGVNLSPKSFGKQLLV
jgi:hypothetical protein